MKILQETQEEKWQFTSLVEMTGTVKRPTSPSEVILLLHGLGERGKRIYRKLLPYLPQDALIIAPNGPFPLPKMKENRISYGHSWYFYDKFEQTYYINQDLAKCWLRDLIQLENDKNLPVTIIGFSQGGYLAPLVGMVIPQTRLVIGLACEFRSTLIQKRPNFTLEAIHGEKDEVISIESAWSEIKTLKNSGITVGQHALTEAGHEITSEMGQKIKSILENHGKRSL